MANFGQCDAFYRTCTDIRNISSDSVIVSVSDTAPYNYESPVGSFCFCGASISLLKDIASSIGLKLIFVPDRRPALFDRNSGAPEDVRDGFADISVCPLSFTRDRLSQYDMVPVFQTNTYQIGVHKSFVNEDLASVLDGVAESFYWDAWMLIAAVCLLSVIILWAIYVFDVYIFAKARPWKYISRRAFLRVVYTVSNAGLVGFLPSSSITSYRFLILSWLLRMIIISTVVVTSLTASLSISFIKLPFDSPSSFLTSDFQIISRPSDTFDPESLKDLKSKRIVINTTLDAVLLDIAINNTEQKNAVVCRNSDAMCRERGFIPAFDLGISRWISVFQLHTQNSVIKPISSRMMTLSEAGIPNHLLDVQKWMSYKDEDESLPTHRHINRDTALLLPRLSRLFDLYFCCIAFSLLTFFLEISWNTQKNNDMVRITER